MNVSFWFGFLLIWLPHRGTTQPSSPDFENISIKNGLVDDHILSVFQDSKGFVWIGTYAGLHRYDGYTFRVFTQDAPAYHHRNLIANNTVYTIIEDRHHTLWIGTEQGLSHYDPATDRFTNYYSDAGQPERGPSHDNIRCLYEDDEGFIWLGTYGGGLNRFDPRTQEFVHFTKDGTFLPSPRINDFYVDKNQRFWIGTEGDGLVGFDRPGDRFEYFRHYPDDTTSLANDVVNKIVEDKSGKLWVGTWGGGVCRFDPQHNTFTRYGYDPETPGTLRSDIVRSLLEDSRGQLWLATLGGGLSLYDRAADRFTTYRADPENPSGLSNDKLWTLFEDRSGLLWVGTYGSGLDVLNPAIDDFVHYERSASPSAQRLSSNQITAFCETQDGPVWIGTIDGGINILDPRTGTISRFDKLREQPMTAMRTLYEDQDRNVWIGTDQGLYCYNPTQDRLKHYRHDSHRPQSIGASGVYCLAQDQDKTLWVGTWESGLHRLEAAEIRKEDPQAAVFQHYRHQLTDSTGLSSDKVWSLHVDKNQDVWVGTDRSLDKLDQATGTFAHLGAMNAGKIIEDEAGVLWVATFGQGIARFNPKTNDLRYYNQLEYIDINLVLDMVLDEHETLWVGSIDGVTKFNTRTEEFVNLDLSHELKQNEYEINVMTQLSTGELMLGGDFGIDRFDPAKIDVQKAVPPVELTDFRVFNQSVTVGDPENEAVLNQTIAYTDEITLTHRESLITLTFAALHFVSQDKHRYAYQLDGFDSEWKYTRADQRQVTYTNLPSGTYTFRLKGATREGPWSAERTLRLTVAPPFWATLPFKVLVVGLLVVGGAALYRRRVRAERNRVAWQHRAEKMMREREIIKLQNEKLHAELEHKKKELASTSLHNIHQNEELSHIRNELTAVFANVEGAPQKHKVKKLLESVDRHIEEADHWMHFEKNVNLLHNNFLQRFTEAYPRLTHKDLKICAFIRMNFDNKEIARMLNITPESLGVSRTRIRKKIDLDRRTYLNDLIVRF